VLSFLEFVVEPRLFNRRRFSSLLVVIVVLVLVDEFGLIGVLLAPPLAAAIQILAGQLMRSTTTAKATLAQPISTLQANLAAVQSVLAAETVPPGPELNNLVDRLGQLIVRADQEV
jgi:predicted PurR-regulated permease PerM